MVLERNSSAFRFGFGPISFVKIGLRASEPCAIWSIVEAEGVMEKPLTSQPARQ